MNQSGKYTWGVSDAYYASGAKYYKGVITNANGKVLVKRISLSYTGARRRILQALLDLRCKDVQHSLAKVS